jgi:hypothetical protein
MLYKLDKNKIQSYIEVKSTSLVPFLYMGQEVFLFFGLKTQNFFFTQKIFEIFSKFF